MFVFLQAIIFLIWAILRKDYFFDHQYWTVGTIGLLVNFAANFLFVYSVSISSFSQSVPMLSFTPVFSVILSFFILGEILSFSQICGVVMFISGAFLLNGMPSFKGDKLGPVLMKFAALFWGLMGVIDKICLGYASIPMHSLFQTTGIGVLAVIYILLTKKDKFEFEKLKTVSRPLLWGTIASIGAVGFQLYVFMNAPVGLVESCKRALTLILTMIFGRIFFKESLNFKKILAVIVMAIGLQFVLR